jgi:hypothetical protein
MSLSKTLKDLLFLWLKNPRSHWLEAMIPVIETIFPQGIMLKNKGDACDQ